jgi:hypothetical protein
LAAPPSFVTSDISNSFHLAVEGDVTEGVEMGGARAVNAGIRSDRSRPT